MVVVDPSARLRIVTLFCAGRRVRRSWAASFFVGPTLNATHFASSEIVIWPGVPRASPTGKRYSLSPCVCLTTTSLSPSRGEIR